MMVAIAEWTGCALGILGAFLLATNSRFSAWGFVSFLLSNVAWIVFALAEDKSGLLIQQVCFTGTSLLGLWQWRGKLGFCRDGTV